MSKNLTFPSSNFHVEVQVFFVTFVVKDRIGVWVFIEDGFSVFEFEMKSESYLGGVDSLAMRTLRIRLKLHWNFSISPCLFYDVFCVSQQFEVWGIRFHRVYFVCLGGGGSFEHTGEGRVWSISLLTWFKF